MPLNPPNVTRHFKRILEKAKIRTSIRLYDLRHTTATLFLQAGINPKIVSERLGHSTITLTLDVYSHVLPNMQKDATDQLEQMIFRKTGTLWKVGTHLAHKTKRTSIKMSFSSMFMVAWDRIELPTRGFSVRCSTNWATKPLAADKYL